MSKKKYSKVIKRLNGIKIDLEENADVLLSVNEIAFLDKLLSVIEDFVNGKLE